MDIIEQFVLQKGQTRQAEQKAEQKGVQKSTQKSFPAQVGDSLNVHVRLKEGNKERVQIFSGVVLKIQGSKSTRSFTVRKISGGVGVERTFPLASPALAKVEVISRAKVRRARLFYLRKRTGRSARLRVQITDASRQST